MGRVYRAHDTTLGRDVAIKLIECPLAGPDQTQQRERFVREARAAARLVHPNIVAVHDVDPDAGWLVMELVDGRSLKDVAADGPLAPALVRAIAEQILRALDAAHAAGVIHRDVKPSNIILSAAGKATLVDFGVARLVDAELTRTGEHLGTPAYMAPEQVRGASVDARTDLYSLAATLYELVTGTRMVAFEAPGDAAVAEIATACGGDAGLAAMIAHCLQPAPAARSASARAALEELAGAAPVAPRRRRRRRLIAPAAIAGGLAAATAVVAYGLAHRPHARDPRLDDAFTLAQRGENDRAGQILESYLGEHPDDPDALTLQVLVQWWQYGVIPAPLARALAAPLAPEQRALVHGIGLVTQQRETEAVAYLEDAERAQPDSPEILYALGEARWHGQRLEDGAATLERAFRVDPRWEMALHHVIEYRISRGEASRLAAIADKLRAVDAPGAAALDCQILVGERRYADAAAGAAKALATTPIPEVTVCRAQAQVLAGDLAGAEVTAEDAFQRWPIDTREWGGFAQHAEMLLYRGKLDDYLALLGGKPSEQRTLALALWRPPHALSTTPPGGSGMRMPPLGSAAYLLTEWAAGRDATAVSDKLPEPEVQDFGRALAAERAGKLPDAIAAYRRALAAPARGDIRMLLAHGLARVLYASGDRAGASEACRDVIAPRLYESYRAVVLPDCLAWSDDRAGWQWLVDGWAGAGSFAHPAVELAKQRLIVH